MFDTGIIVMWSGSIVNIPAGWALCNGSNGTPDLRNRFIVGAGDTYAVDATGGATSHNHTFNANDHTHTLGIGTDVEAGDDFDAESDIDASFGTTDGENHLPTYHALAFIMKL